MEVKGNQSLEFGPEPLECGDSITSGGGVREAGLGKDAQELSLGQSGLEMSVKNPNGDATLRVECSVLEFRRTDREEIDI